MVVLAAPLALFLLFDRDARKALATPGPWVALVVALVVMAPHLLWLVQNDFLPFAYASARAAPSRGLFDHVLHPVVFAVSQLVFLLPALLIAAALVWPRRRRGSRHTIAADAFDRRIVTLLAFGPAATTVALSAISGRGTIAMWGYPLWLFLGLWIVLARPDARSSRHRWRRIGGTWAAVFARVRGRLHRQLLGAAARSIIAIARCSIPAIASADELARRYRAATGRPLAYVIGTMWDGGNVAHYAAEQPRVLIDGDPRRAPWIDLGDLRSKGAVVVWTDGDPDRHAGRPARRWPATPRCSRRSRCRSAAATARSRSAGRSCGRSRVRWRGRPRNIEWRIALRCRRFTLAPLSLLA